MNLKQLGRTALYGVGKLIGYSIVGVLGLCAILLAISVLLGLIVAVGGLIGGVVVLSYNAILGTTLDPTMGAIVGSFLALFTGSSAASSQ